MTTSAGFYRQLGFEEVAGQRLMHQQLALGKAAIRLPISMACGHSSIRLLLMPARSRPAASCQWSGHQSGPRSATSLLTSKPPHRNGGCHHGSQPPR